MSFSLNIAVVTGNVTKDPELRYTPTGTAVCSFGVATSYSIKKGDQWEEKTTFHNIVVWGKQAEFISNNVKKGGKITVQGRIENRSYDAKDGTRKYISEIVADTVIPFLDKRIQSANDVEDIIIPDDIDNEAPAKSIEEADDMPF